jgi:hypothetical protein
VQELKVLNRLALYHKDPVQKASTLAIIEKRIKQMLEKTSFSLEKNSYHQEAKEPL